MKTCYQCRKPLAPETKPVGKWSFKGRSHFLYLCSSECANTYYQRKAEVAATVSAHDPFSR